MTTNQKENIDLRYHSNNCSICNHPECKHIEDDYANFMDNKDIAKKYSIKKECLEQHCLALRLWVRKAHNIPMVMVNELQRGLGIKPKPRFADLTALAESIRKDLGLYQHRDVLFQLYQMSPDAIQELAKEALKRSLASKDNELRNRLIDQKGTRVETMKDKDLGEMDNKEQEDGVATIETASPAELCVPLTEDSVKIGFSDNLIPDKDLDVKNP